MKIGAIPLVILIVVLRSLMAEAQSQSHRYLLDSIPTQGKVVFLGNSITYAGQYIDQFTAAWLLHIQDQEIEFFNLGLPSETVSGLSEEGHANGEFPRPNLHDRLDRVLTTIVPNLIFACYGMNDGIYLPFDERRFSLYTEGIEKLKRKAEESGARIIFLTPPVFDPLHGKDYAEVLDVYSNWLLRKKDEWGWEVIDIHWPMHAFLEEKRSKEKDFYLAKDGVHPGELGHWLMARELLMAIGIKEAVNVNDHHSFFGKFPNGKRVLALSAERNEHTRDFWLEKTGHKRPGLSKGLSEVSYGNAIREIDRKIKEALTTK